MEEHNLEYIFSWNITRYLILELLIFWRNYTTLLKRFRIPAKSIPWYRRHVEGFLADNSNIRLRSHTAESVEKWFEHIGRDTRINTWQYRQKVDALRILFGHFLRHTWCSEFDWDRWLNRAPALESDYTTIARTYEMIEKSVIRIVQALLGHSDVSTTMIYTHVIGRGEQGARSPLDRLVGVGQ